MLGPDRRPIGVEMVFLVGMREAVEEMAGFERRTTVEPTSLRKILHGREAAHVQCSVDQLDRAHRKPRMMRPESLGESADYFVVRAAFGIGRQHGPTDL